MIKIIEEAVEDSSELKNINLVCKDDNNNLENLLNYIKELSTIGHSFQVVVDPNDESREKSFEIDGDGMDQLIKVNIIEPEVVEEDIKSTPNILKEENIVKVIMEQNIETEVTAEDSEDEDLLDEQEALEEIEIDEAYMADELYKYMRDYSYEDEYKEVYNSVRRVTISYDFDSIKCIIELGKEFDDNILNEIFSDFISEVVLQDDQLSGFGTYTYTYTHDEYYDDWSDTIADGEKEIDFNFATRALGEQTTEIER